MSGRRPQVVVVEDAPLIREGLCQLLMAAGCDVSAALPDAGGLSEALDKNSAVDVVVLDIRMPPTHTDEGIRALEQLRADGSTVGVLLLSMYASPTLAYRALSAGGATGYLLKDRVGDVEDFVSTLRRVANGGSALDPTVVSRLLAARTDWRPLYDRDRLAANEVPAAAAVYHDDMYVDTTHALRTARAIRGLRTWVTDEFEHDGVRAGGPRVLDRLLALVRDEV